MGSDGSRYGGLKASSWHRVGKDASSVFPYYSVIVWTAPGFIAVYEGPDISPQVFYSAISNGG